MGCGPMKTRLALLSAPLVIALLLIGGLLLANHSTAQFAAAVTLPVRAVDASLPRHILDPIRPAAEDSRAAEPQEDVLGLVLTKTVGTAAGECAATGELAVWGGRRSTTAIRRRTRATSP